MTAGSRGSLSMALTLTTRNQQAFARKYSRAAGDVDDRISRVLNALRDSGKLDNTVVIITAGRGIPLNARNEETFDWSHGHLQVPLVIHWPGTPAQRINAILTDHTDLMTTLMQRLLHVQHTCQRIFARSGFVQRLNAVITGLLQRITIRWQLPPRKKTWC
ncbi:sulfatase-like hydrolase/transferase [Escherichia coli]|nr:sulfatase-like hydrolase/transferase [Escherichia coli]